MEIKSWLTKIEKYNKRVMKFLRKRLERSLAFLAKMTLLRFKPLVIGVTGSVGKTSTKEAIYTVLRTTKAVRRNRGNFNNEIGFPLTVFGDYSEIGGVVFWILLFLKATTQLILPKFLGKILFGAYPEVLVLEYAADKPGDISYLVKIAKPDIAVITAIGDIPVHVEFYESPEKVLKEKTKLVDQLSKSAHAILNADEERIVGLKAKTKAVVTTFGFSPKADLSLSSFETYFESTGRGTPKRPMGIRFQLGTDGNSVPIRIAGTLGKTQAYAAGAAAAVALRLGLSLVQIAEAFTYFQVPSQRVKLVTGKKGSYIIDDSYNASPISVTLAIETVSELEAKRKIAVLGDMKELGEFSEKSHREVGRLASKVFDLIIAVGKEAKYIAQSAKQAKMPKEKVFHFENAEQVEKFLLEKIQKGDLVLIKGSKAVGLKKVAESARLGKIIE